MPILKTYNLSVADFTENKNVYYLYPDNWSHQKGSDIIKILRDSDFGIPLYIGLSPVKPFEAFSPWHQENLCRRDPRKRRPGDKEIKF